MNNKKVRIFALSIIVLLVSAFLLINHYQSVALRDKLVRLSAAEMLEEYFTSLNQHNTKEVKQIVFNRNNMYKRFSDIESITLLQSQIFEKRTKIINHIEYKEEAYSVAFEVKYKASRKGNVLESGKYNWIFTLVQKNGGGQWQVYDFGY